MPSKCWLRKLGLVLDFHCSRSWIGKREAPPDALFILDVTCSWNVGESSEKISLGYHYSPWHDPLGFSLLLAESRCCVSSLGGAFLAFFAEVMEMNDDTNLRIIFCEFRAQIEEQLTSLFVCHVYALFHVHALKGSAFHLRQRCALCCSFVRGNNDEGKVLILPKVCCHVAFVNVIERAWTAAVVRFLHDTSDRWYNVKLWALRWRRWYALSKTFIQKLPRYRLKPRASSSLAWILFSCKGGYRSPEEQPEIILSLVAVRKERIKKMEWIIVIGIDVSLVYLLYRCLWSRTFHEPRKYDSPGHWLLSSWVTRHVPCFEECRNLEFCLQWSSKKRSRLLSSAKESLNVDVLEQCEKFWMRRLIISTLISACVADCASNLVPSPPDYNQENLYQNLKRVCNWLISVTVGYYASPATCRWASGNLQVYQSNGDWTRITLSVKSVVHLKEPELNESL